MRSSFNVVIFGEAGVGKSSVINLIAGKKVAETSSDSWGCTLESKQYAFQVADKTFNVWDTIGLGEIISSATGCLSAVEKAESLIQQIAAEGGLDLLLFCISGSGSRISETTISNYKLFFEELCKKRTPIALVVTHLEGETKLDGWWVRNVDYLNKCGLKFSGHACVTGLPEHEKARESRGALKDLLLEFVPRDRCMVDGDDARKPLAPHADNALLPTQDPRTNRRGICRSELASNIILFGEAGVSKSSVINLIAGKDIAEMSPDRWGCTLDSKHYTFEVRSRTFNIWETIGLKGCSFGTIADCLDAIEKTRALIKQIEDKGGLDLLLFCIPGHIPLTSTVAGNYRLFSDVLCNGEIPIALVVTHLENAAGADGWWDQNKDWFFHRGLQFTEHASVTSPEHPHSATYQRAFVDILLKFNHEIRHAMPDASAWLSGFLGRLPIIPFRAEVKINPQELEALFRDRCMALDADACKLAAERFCHTDTEFSSFPGDYCPVEKKSSFNIVLFGESGVGKSSVVNLIANKEVAETSSDHVACTMKSEKYSFPVEMKTFNIWDTVGLGGPLLDAPETSIEQAYKLIQQIEAEGGLDLLLFCIRGSRITETMRCNYRLFFEVLCEKKIPISVVVTHLEGENLMEFWWLRNRVYFKKSDLKFSGHACVTGRPKSLRQAAEGRFALESLLLKFDGRGRYPMPPASDWFDGFLAQLITVRIPKLLKVSQTRKELEKLLCDRCNMGSNEAKRLAENLILLRNQDRR